MSFVAAKIKMCRANRRSGASRASIYATLPAAQLGLSVTPEQLGDLITLGREIKWALDDSDYAKHPTDPRLNGIYGMSDGGGLL